MTRGHVVELKKTPTGARTDQITMVEVSSWTVPG